jgi:phage shock protein C
MGITNDLERLAELHRSGALSDTEFASAKTRALADVAEARTDGVLEALHTLRRSRRDHWLGGVCGGLARMSGLPTWMWRLIFVSLVLCAGTGLMVYLLLWLLVPKEETPVAFDTGAMASS